tara:strand:- start:349 stop:2577 length:2229 start_codon:yes stop_codon:yes gene_type:complete
MSLSSLQLDSSGEFDLLYNFFYVKNYKGVETYESYALPFTPLTFIPNLDDGIADFVSNKRIVWDFGDGTTTESVTASHNYEKPGRYTVNCYLYDSKGTGYFDTYSAKVNITDFITDKLTISAASELTHNTGQILNPITVERYNSYRTLNSGIPSIVAYSSAGVGDNDYFRAGLADETYGHLKPSSSFVQILTTNGIAETVQVDTITTTNTPIYIKLSSNEIVYTDVNDVDGFYAGLTGTGDTYFKTDIIGSYNLLLGFEQGSIFDYANTTTYGVSADIGLNDSYSKLTFSSNGIDGEGKNTLSTFDIGKTKFAGSKVSFVVKVKDSDTFSQKNMPLLSTNNSTHLDLYLTDGTTTYDVEYTSNLQALSTINSGGFFKGYFVSDTTTTLENVYLSGSMLYDGNSMVGQSNTFTIYPSSFYTVAKVGENIDFEAAFKDIAIQPLFSDAKILMSDFIGSIFGDISATQDSIGKSTYEKIQNFFDNNTTIDESNIEQLDGILQMLDLPELTKYSLPPKLNRVMDILSISKSKLFGSRNRDNTHYQSYGYQNNDYYGYNLGDKLEVGSEIIVGEPIVANEKYSGKFVTLNTTFPLSARVTPIIEVTTGFVYGTSTGQLISAATEELSEGVPITRERLEGCEIITEQGVDILTQSLSSSSTYYRLSDYNSTWGWPLLSGGGREITDIYNFYYQKDSVGEIENSIINFTDPNNTISYNLTSYSDWSMDAGTMSNIFAQSLYEGLELFED